MKIIIAENYENMSEIAAGIISKTIIAKPDAVLGLATGTTPIGTYKKLIDYYKNGLVSFSNVHTVNLDEYVGLPEKHEQSYHYFMHDMLFDHIDIKKGNIHIPCGLGNDLDKNCKDYDAVLKKYPRDIQLLGIGANGHIGFNEPNTPFKSFTHIVELTERTRHDNARLFGFGDSVPKQAITMGIVGICHAKRILILASGANKADAVYAMVKGDVTPECPASILQLHNDAILVVDKAAASKLDDNKIAQAV